MSLYLNLVSFKLEKKKKKGKKVELKSLKTQI